MKDDTYKNIWDFFKEKGIDPIQTLPHAMIQRIESIGAAKEKLANLLDDDVWLDLSKHNPFWDSEYEKESDKLHDLRLKLSLFHEKLWEIHGTLCQRNEE